MGPVLRPRGCVEYSVLQSVPDTAGHPSEIETLAVNIWGHEGCLVTRIGNGPGVRFRVC